MKKDIQKVLVIGSGPIVIGQAAEFDYSGTQACLALREEGVTSVVVNPNPATIQTDHEIADRVYIEPLTVESLEKIIATEKPDGLLATVGGQSGLNLGTQLAKRGILKKYGVEVLGTDIAAIARGEDRKIFAETMTSIHQPVLPSHAVTSESEALKVVKDLGFPVIIRSAYTLGGAGGSIARSLKDFKAKVLHGLQMSPIHQVLLEKSVIGWGEFEYEMVRDAHGNSISVCNMENISPMGVHTGDSMVVAPSQTLSDRDHQKLRTAALKIVASLDIQGACNVQFAFNYHTGEYFVIEVNPRLSRSSALASKATGYPIAKVATKIALGFSLPEITNDITGKTAFFEPSLDYIVVKIPRWPFDKFPDMDKELGIAMKSTGEVMAIGRTFEEAFRKGIESLDMKDDLFLVSDETATKQKILKQMKVWTGDQLQLMLVALRNGVSVKEIAKATQIQPWFVTKLQKMVLEHTPHNTGVYKMVDTCSGEFPALTPYFYSTNHGTTNEATALVGKKVIILGSGPIRIGQGIEFDYMTVHSIKALEEDGIKTIIINNNPETVSTDYSIADRLYFEPLTTEYVLQVIRNEATDLLGIICQFGGQTALNQAEILEKAGVNILGTKSAAIKKAEDRLLCSQELTNMGLRVPQWTWATTGKEMMQKCEELGFPVLIRPSFVLAGEGVVLVENKDQVKAYLSSIPSKLFDRPVMIDRFIGDAMEVDIDFVSDGKTTKAFVLEQREPTGIHSGDSTSVYPARSIDPKIVKKLELIADDIAKQFGIIGLGNIQAAIKDGEIYIIEVNPRASRTIPFLSKATGIPLVKIATRVSMGHALKNMDSLFINPNGIVSVKKPIFSFEKLPGLSTKLGSVMKSTGEAMAVGKTVEEALFKISTKVSIQ